MEKTHEIWVGSPALIQEGNESKRLWICCFLMGSSSLRQLKPLGMGRKAGAVWDASLSLATGSTALQTTPRWGSP